MTGTDRLDATRARQALATSQAGGLIYPAVDPGQDNRDLRAYEAALRAVLERHRPIPVYAYADECGHDEDDHEVIVSSECGYLCADTPTGDYQCDACRVDGNGAPADYPCPTVTDITRHLEEA